MTFTTSPENNPGTTPRHFRCWNPTGWHPFFEFSRVTLAAANLDREVFSLFQTCSRPCALYATQVSTGTATEEGRRGGTVRRNLCRFRLIAVSGSPARCGVVFHISQLPGYRRHHPSRYTVRRGCLGLDIRGLERGEQIETRCAWIQVPGDEKAPCEPTSIRPWTTRGDAVSTTTHLSGVAF